MAFWSLATEAKFYLLAPLIVLALRGLRRDDCYIVLGLVIFGLLLIKIAQAWSGPPITDDLQFFTVFRTPFHMAVDSLVAGMACCFLWHDESIKSMLKKPLCANGLFGAGAALFLGLAALVQPYYEHSPASITFFAETTYFSLIALAFSAVLLGLLGGCFASRAFEGRALRGVAIVSYSLYLIHLLFVRKALQFAANLLPSSALPDTSWQMCTGTIILLMMALPVSAWLYYFIERPFIQWAHKPSAEALRVSP